MTEDRKGVDGSGPAARRARRNVKRASNRREAKFHGTPLPDPEETTRMVIPDHIAALGKEIEDEQRP